MKLTIHYRAQYSYEEPASLSPHVVRLFPRDVLHACVTKLEFSTNASADVHWRRDIFDNLVACCFYPHREPRLVYSLDAEVETAARNPFGFLLESRALKLPVEYDGREREVLTACFAENELALPDGLRPDDDLDTVEALVGMNQWIHRNIAYERREEGEAFAPEETLRRRSGACRDTAVLLAAAMRARGFAARLASGYLWESASDPSERKADSALHAWTEVYLPGAGWVAMDPSNGVFADHHYLTAAVGLAPEDVAPVSGLYYGDQPIRGRLATLLRIERA